MDWLAPFAFPFMQNAFWIAFMLAPGIALLSCFVVLKGWSLMGDAISHAVLPGLVLASIVGIPLILGAFIAAMLCGFASGYLASHSRIKSDTVMGVVFSAMFGFGLVLYAAVPSEIDLHHILFGNMLGIDRADLVFAGSVGGALLCFLVVFGRDLTLFVFDPVQARALGMNTGLIHNALLAAISMSVVALLSAVGLILAIGLLIVPGAIGFLVARQFWAMAVWAIAATWAAMFAGIYVSFFIDSAPAPTIIVMLSAVFLVCFTIKSFKLRMLQRRAAA